MNMLNHGAKSRQIPTPLLNPVALHSRYTFLSFSGSMSLHLHACPSPQHISSRRHKDRAAGKPAKPKFSPYTSSQRHHSLQSVSALRFLPPAATSRQSGRHVSSLMRLFNLDPIVCFSPPQIRLTLQKTQNLTKPLASCLIPQLSVAAAIGSLPSFPLHPTSSSSHALFQAQPLPQALLHPAPGPMAPTHSQVLFSPY